MLRAVTVLLLYQLAGEVLVRAAAVPVPGPVVGMLLLLVTLLVRGRSPASLTETSHGLLRHLGLLYVPAGTGIMVHLALIRREWLPIAVTLAASTVLTLLITGWTLRWLLGRVHAARSVR